MPTAKEKLYASSAASVAIGRQVAQGVPNVRNLYKTLNTQVDPKLASQLSDLGVEVGAGTISEQRQQKETFMPDININAHIRVGAFLMNLLSAADYMALTTGVAPGSPVNTTLSAPITSRFSRVLPLASTTGLAGGDLLQVGSLATPGTPVITDRSGVHQILPSNGIGPQNHTWIVTLGAATGGNFKLIYGGQTTANIAYNATAATVQSALQALSSVGASNMTVTGSAGGPYTVVGAGTLAALTLGALTADASGLTGTTAPGTTTGPYVSIVNSIVGLPSGSVAIVGSLLYAYPTGTAVAKVDPNQALTSYFPHVQPDNSAAGGGDLFTVYVKLGNGVTTAEWLLVDCKLNSLVPSFQNGQIATFSAELKALHVTRDPALLSIVNILSDPSSITVNNTRGNFSLLGDTVNAPRQLNFNLQTTVFDDTGLTLYEKQSAGIISHSINITTLGKFIKAFWDTINWGNATNIVVNDAIPESSFNFTAQSAKTVGTSNTPYSFSINAPSCQFANYDPKLNSNQPVDAGIEMCRVVPDQTTGNENWFFTLVNACPTDVCSPV